jgi:hypothetical protein
MTLGSAGEELVRGRLYGTQGIPALRKIKCATSHSNVALAFSNSDEAYCDSPQSGSRRRRLVSGAQPPVRFKICDCTLKRVPEPRFLSSLQDEFGSCSVTGGAPNGDRWLLSDILSGLNALSSAWDTHALDFALNLNSVIQPAADSLTYRQETLTLLRS